MRIRLTVRETVTPDACLRLSPSTACGALDRFAFSAHRRRRWRGGRTYAVRWPWEPIEMKVATT
jgi:hypothetical protein